TRQNGTGTVPGKGRHAAGMDGRPKAGAVARSGGRQNRKIRSRDLRPPRNDETRNRRGPPVDENCVCCRISGGEEMVSIVYEDDDAVAFLDIQPMSQGHTLIATKQHYETLFDVPEELAAHCLALARRLAPGLRSATSAPAI